MFEKEIKFIGDFSFNQVTKLGTHFTLEKVVAAGVHPAIIQYISAELDFMIYSDRRKLLQQSYFDYTGKEISDHFLKISNEIKRNKKISLEDSKKLIFQAVSFNVNYLVRPRWSLSKLIFNDQPLISVEEMKMMLNYLYYYDYFRNVLSGYISKRNIFQISSTELELILGKIDKELVNSNKKLLIENAFNSMGDFFNIGGVDKNLVLMTAVEIFFKEKSMLELLLKLRKSLPNVVKKQYDKNELEKILFSPDTEVRTETTPEEKPEGVVEEAMEEKSGIEIEPEQTESEVKPADEIEKTGAESFLSPEEEQALLSLYNEEPKQYEELTDEQVSISEFTTEDQETLETVTTEQLEEKTEEPVREVEDKTEEVTEKITEDLSVEETKIEEISIDEPTESTEETNEDVPVEEMKIEETISEETKESIETETVDQLDEEEIDAFIPGLEKEIVQEMIKDFYGEGEPDSQAQDEKVQELKEKEESVPDEKEVKTKIETLEDELLGIFKNLDKEEESDVEEPKPNKEETENLSLDLEEHIEEEQKTVTEDLDNLDEYIKSINDVIFSDKTENKDEVKKNVEFEDIPKKPVEKIEPVENEIPQQPVDKIETPVKENVSNHTFEQQFIKPRDLRPKDLFSYLRRKDIKKIVFLIFSNDEEDFINTADRVMDCQSYKEASEILKAVFTSYKISPYSKEAITFTNAVSNYFRQA